ncbi:M56 family metallopeptidase [Psychroserpens sp. S379A]|uniref:M56 family metallopeptidase n=1 Tax=Psychroserpens sp. S379A TaxID=3415137 RepID=UPI003C7A0F14
MLIYILKSSVCLAIFMLFYKLVLERTSIHKLKRFYLLATFGLAFIIPLITFTEYIEPTFTEHQTIPTTNHIITNDVVSIEEKANYFPLVFAIIYSLGTFFFFVKFSLNLKRIFSRIHQNPIQKNGRFINVLIENLSVPHTFLHYLFFNKSKFENNEIPKEVILHEQTHAKQKHSLDIIFIELLQILFWFNPLIYLIKKDIKLNHEFLADSEVLKQGILASKYQNTILAFSSKANNNQLANAINYSSIKKRFTVMKTQTSKTSIWLKSLLLFPLIAFTLYSFSEKIQVEKEVNKSTLQGEASQQNSSLNDNSKSRTSIQNAEIDLYLNEKGDLLYDDKIITIQDLSSLYPIENDMNVSITTSLNTEKTLITSISKRIQGFLREQGLKTFSVCVISKKNKTQEGATQEQVTEYNIWAKKINMAMKKAKATNDFSTYPIIKKKDIDHFEHIYHNLMSVIQRNNAEPWPNFPPPPPPPPIPKNATSEQRKKMQAVIDDYEKQHNQKIHTVKKDNLVKTGFIKINGIPHYFVKTNNEIKYYNRKGYEVSKTGKVLSNSQVNASDVIPGQYITKVYSDGKVVAQFKNNKPNLNGQVNIPAPSKAPKPVKIEVKQKKTKSPKTTKNKTLKEVSKVKSKENQLTKSKEIKTKLDESKSKLGFITEMTKDMSLRFCYNGKTITRNRAIRIAKNNPKIHIRLGIEHNTKQNIIYLSKRKPLIGYKG